MKRVLVTGAGGFIGHNLIRRLKADGCWVRGADLKLPEYSDSDADEFQLVDLRQTILARNACFGVDEIYHLAADMGGIGYISTHHSENARNSNLINLNMLEAVLGGSSKPKFLFSSSACIYPVHLQTSMAAPMLKEEDAVPSNPEDGYGWEKLWMEQLLKYAREDNGLDVRVVRFHNVYGPEGTYDGGKEKAPAALSRKIALTDDGGEIEVWGDGRQTRSFLYIDDCVEGLVRLMASGHQQPLNLGSDRLVSINDLIDILADIAGKKIRKRHDTTKWQGVRGRNSDNTRLKEVLKWEPQVHLEAGLTWTYKWVEKRVCHK